MSEITKVLEIAKKEVGYLEKKSNKDLDFKTKNAGYNNYTKYARDMDNLKVYNGKKQGYPWCSMFVDWCFVKAFGVKRAKELLGGFSAGVEIDYRLMKKHTKTPKKGDIIFFGNLDHIGIVYKVTADRVYTYEGNTSGSSGLEANGGQVAGKSYNLNASYIYGYGRPPYKASSTKNNNNSGKKETTKTGTYIVTASLLNVRSGAGTQYKAKTYKDLTANARKQNKALGNERANGYLKGVVCTVTEVKNNWGKTASGWVCLDYCKKK